MTKVEKEVIAFLEKEGPVTAAVLEAKLLQNPKFFNKFKRQMKIRKSLYSLLTSGAVIINKDRKLERRDDA